MVAVALVGATAAAIAAVPGNAPAAPALTPPPKPKPALAPETLFAEPAAATVALYATVRSGDSLRDLLIRSGAAELDASAAADLVREALPAGLPQGSEVVVLLGSASGKKGRRLERVSFQPGPAFKIMIGRTRAGDLKLARETLVVDATPQRFQGRAGSNLFWAMRAAGVPASSAREYLEVLSSRTDLHSIRPSDEFDLVVDSMRGTDGKARLGSLLYAGIRGARQVNLVRWTVDGQSGWFDPDSPQQRVDGFKQPVSGRMTSAFGYRIHPILRFGRFHQGVDFGAAKGTPVFAAADGVVLGAGWNGGHGRQVRLAHSDGVSTSYSHLSEIIALPGTRIRRGQLVGLVGSSGFSTGAHLHFEVRRHGQPVDPLTFRPANSETSDSGELAAIRARLDQLQSI